MRFAPALLLVCGACSSFSSANEVADAGAVGDASSGPPPIASDGFERALAVDLGDADVGGHWTIGGSQAFSVADGMGSVLVKPGATGAAYLESVDVTDVDTAVTYKSSDFGSATETLYMTLAARRTAETFYACVAIVRKDSVAVALSTGSKPEDQITERPAGFTLGASEALRVRFVVRGTNPTKLSCRAWKAGSAEPSGWQADATDSTAALQVAGDIGFRVYLSASAPLNSVVRFDDFLAQPPR